MTLPEFGVKKPVTNLMIFLAVIILAFYSLTRIGIDSFPKIEPPSITVISGYPGASPEDVESKVTEALENQLGTTPGLESLSSVSSEGLSRVTLKFIWGTNLDEASNDIRDRLDQAKRFLPDIPDEMDNPFIFKFNTSNIPILFIGITAKETYSELYDLIDQRIGDALRQLPGVGTVQIQGGGLQRQVNVWVDRPRLEGYGISVLDIQKALKQENITQPVGNLKSGLTDYLIRLPGEFSNPDEINKIILGKYNDSYVYLKDVARVEDSFKEVTSIVRINKQPGIMLAIQKQSGTNTVEVAERVKKKLNSLESGLPADVKLNIMFDNSRDVINSLDSLKSSLWFAIILVILVVWFFLRHLASSLIVALTIPFSLLISFIYLFLSGRTINTISLSSIAIASGMVVDNAIVVVDNITRYIERGNSSKDAAIFGAKEMFLAISASTLTTVVVFLPMLFIPGVVGIMFGELAIIVTVTLLASLFTAVTFTPMLCSKWLKIIFYKKVLLGKFLEASEKIFAGWENFYSAQLARCLRHKKLVIFGFLGMFVGSLFLIRFVGNEFIPETDTGDIRLTVHLPVGTRLEEANKLTEKIESILDEFSAEMKFYYVREGSIPGVGRSFGFASGTNIVSCGTKLIPKTQRKRSVWEISQALRKKLRALAGVLRVDISTGNPIGRLIAGGAGKAVQLEIIGHSFEDTDKLAAKIKGIMENVSGAVDVSVSREENRPELKIEVDREKALSLGLNMENISNTLKTFVQGSTATKYREKGRTYDILVRLEESSRSSLEDLENLYVVSGLTGKQIKLATVAKIYEVTGPREIERKNRERVVKVECNVFGRSSGKVVEDIKRELAKLVIPADVMLNFGGEAEEQKKAFKDLSLLFILGISLVYMVMAAQFESLLEPFVVMFSMPFTFTGVILGFLFTGTSLSVITFLGVIMLMGIVVNNAIVLISYIQILCEKGLSLKEAVIQGGRDRLRPVLMTTVTTLVGLLPLAISRGEGSESWQPLGITMLGGLSFSTLITMFFIPTLYVVFSRKKNSINNKGN